MKQYFTGKTGCLFWVNVLVAGLVIMAVPIFFYFTLSDYTHHGEKIEVPSVVGEKGYEAERILKKAGLEPVVTDSVFKQSAKPGTVLKQNPAAGQTVKSAHVISLTISLYSEPQIKLPDLANNSSLREASAQLEALGFKLTDPMFVEGQPKDLVLAVKQRGRPIRSGEMVNKGRPLTIVAGGGIDEEEFDDTISQTMLKKEYYAADTFDLQRNVYQEVQ